MKSNSRHSLFLSYSLDLQLSRLSGLLWSLVFGFLLFLNPAHINAQEINFGEFGNYTITLDNITMGDLVFEEPILSGGGIYEVELSNAYVMSIIGVKYLDVGVEITADGELLLDGDMDNIGDPQRSIPFTLQAAYANRTQNNISDAIFIPVTSNLGNTRFPILARQNQPPGPPPTPPTQAFNQSLVEETAYLYFYGQIDVGNVLAGTYSGTITINVEYN